MIEKKLRRIPDEVTEADKVGRVDLRHLPLVTIDGEDARDFDDAVYAEKKQVAAGVYGSQSRMSVTMYAPIRH